MNPGNKIVKAGANERAGDSKHIEGKAGTWLIKSPLPETGQGILIPANTPD